MDRSRSRGAAALSGSLQRVRVARRCSLPLGLRLRFETLEARYAPNVLIAGGGVLSTKTRRTLSLQSMTP
jgi:hypothetical protein